MTNEQRVLTALRNRTSGEKISCSFNSLSRDLNIPRDELDKILRALEMNRYIDQWVMKDNDLFIVTLR